MSEYKSKRKLQYEEEDDDVEEEEMEDDYRKNQFFDDEAEEDDEEESEDHNMSAREKKELEDQRERFKKIDQKRDKYNEKFKDVNKYVDELNERVKMEDEIGYEDIEYPEQELPEKPAEAFGVYMVRCKQGKERDIAMRIMKIWIHEKEHKMHMFSVFVPEEKKGIIYVEVMDKRKFVDAVDGVRDIYVNSIKELDDKQMRELMIARLPGNIEPNSYVMIDNGVYKGDVGIVLNQIDQRNVLVKLVPRFDTDNYLVAADIKRLQRQQEDIDDDEEKEDIQRKITNKRKGKEHMTANKTRQLFIPEELGILDVVDVVPDTMNNQVVYKFNGQTFNDGFIHKVFRLNQLKFNDIKPSQEDMQFFYGNDLAVKAQMRSQRVLEIKKGDKVRIVSTNEKMFGKKTYIYSVTAMPNAMPDDEDHMMYTVYGIDLNDFYILKRNEFELFYEVNDRVKVIEGTYQGETGIIEKINEEDQTIIFKRDRTETYITISLMDIQLTEETNMKIQQLGEYRINDYVSLNEGVGIIMNILFDTNLFEIWTDQNKKIEVDESQIQGVVNERKDHKTKDRNKQMIMKGEIVKIANGLYAGREAEILHIHDFTKVFVKIPGILENKGIVVVQSNAIQKKIASTRGNATEYFGRKEREIKKEKDDFDKPSSGKSLDQLKVGTLITLTKKGFKNYTGKITKKVGDKYEVLVISTNKKMKFTRNEFVLKGEMKREKDDEDSYYAQTPSRSYESSSFGTPKPVTPMTGRSGDYMGRMGGNYPPATPSGQYHSGFSQMPPQTPAGQYNRDYQTPVTPMYSSNYGYGQNLPATPANH